MPSSHESLRDRDRRLVGAARRGDVAAFEELYRHYRDWAFRLALRRSGNREDATDVVQEAFLYVLRRLPELELTGRLSTLLYPTIEHLAADARRRGNRHTSDDEAVAAALRVEDPADDHAARRRADLAGFLRRLPDEQREVLLLRFVDDFALSEVAAALGIPLGTVKSRLHAALQALRADAGTRGYFGQD